MHLAHKIKLYNLIRMLSLLQETQAYVKIKDLNYIYTYNEKSTFWILQA